MARISLVKQIYDMSTSLTSKKKLREAHETVKKLKKRKRFTAEERARLQEALRLIRLELLLNREEKRFLEVSKLTNDIFNKK